MRRASFVLHSAFAALLLAGICPHGYAAEAATAPGAQITGALTGKWVGVLEYCDYSEPPTSTRRVKLPTWLTIAPCTDGAVCFAYTYDDGPAKVVTGADVLRFDPPGHRWTTLSDGKTTETLNVIGFEGLKEGRGELVGVGPGIESGKAVEERTTLRIRRNLLELTLESRAPGADFSFRHAYVFTREAPPAVPLTPQK